ncbi:MAG: hypothetical protein IT380_25645 [Myxococcales bacterium]|nr:hypothetical protein [Myxococcales bacterium]
MANTAVLQLHQRETFERNVTRALVAGAGAGVLAFLTQKLHLAVPLPFLALVAAALACVRGGMRDRLMLAGLAIVLPALPWLFGLSAAWSVGLAGVAAGALMVKARIAEKGEEGSVASDRPGPFHYVATALATGGLAVAGTEVANVLSARMADVATPSVLSFAVSGVVIALFAGIGSIASHIALASDPVEARCEELLPQLSGEFEGQIARALSLYRQCGTQLAALPREAAREELARTLSKLTKDAADLAAEWAGVEAQLHDSAHSDLKKEIAELKKSAAAARDAVARQQLEGAASSLEEELERLGELKLKRERVLAKLKSQVALLERARVALIGMRSSHATVRAAEMSAVSRKLNALALAQSDEAKLAHEVATGAELKASEVAKADEEVKKAMESIAPVVPVTSEPEAAAAPKTDESLKN